MSGFKNRALTRVGDVITSHCILCGALIGDENTMDFYALISRKYCKKCSEQRQKENLAFRQKQYKKRKKKTMKEVKSWVDDYRIENRLLREHIQLLQNELDDIKRRVK